MEFSPVFDNTVAALFDVQSLYFALAAIGLNLHFGYTGLLNFGQAGFMAVGAYSISMGVTYFDLPFLATVPLGLAMAVVLALLLGVPTLRLRADYLAIVTIAASEVIRQVAGSVAATKYTGGPTGKTGYSSGFYELNPFPAGQYGLGPAKYNSNQFFLLVVGWTLVVLGCLLVWLLMRSPWGRVLRAIREDEDAARSLGKNVLSYKMQSLVLGGVFGALAGFVIALGNGSVQPGSFSTLLTFLIFTAMILGGAGRVLGPVVGAIVFSSLFVFIENVLIQLTGPDGVIPESVLKPNEVSIVRYILVGLLLMLLMIFRPQGFFGDKRELALDGR
jgi:branched-chain amino acid transport system permease protein